MSPLPNVAHTIASHRPRCELPKSSARQSGAPMRQRITVVITASPT